MNADFNIKMTVRNARLLRLVREHFGTTAEMARKSGLSQSQLSALMTMRERPINANGEWREIALDVAAWLGADASEIWPQHMQERQVKTATAELELSSEQVAALVAPHDDPAEVLERHDTVARLLSCLSERERSIVERRMHGATYEDVAVEDQVTRERIRQVELKAHRKMRTLAVNRGLA